MRFIFKFGAWRGAVNADRENFRAFLEEIRADSKKILGLLPPALVTGNSPIRLTEVGEAISKELNATAWAVELVTTLSSEVKDKEDFEIQDFCFDYVKGRLPDQVKRAVKKSAYERGLQEDKIYPVLVVVLRDKLLASLPTGDSH